MWEDPAASQYSFPLVSNNKHTAGGQSVFNERRKNPSDKRTSQTAHTLTRGLFINTLRQ